MDYVEQLKQFIKELLEFINVCCPPMRAREMFSLEEKARELGIY